MTRKNIYIIVILALLTVVSGLHIYFVGQGKVNPFLFYDYYNNKDEKGIYLSAYVYELGYLLQILVVLLISKYITVSKTIKNIISPFIWIALLDILDYICFYKQMSYYKLPLLIVLILYYNRSWILKSEKK